MNIIIKSKKSNNKFLYNMRIRSFKFALNRLMILIKEEHNSRIHFAISILVVGTSILLKINKEEWLFVMLAIAIVFICEILNSSIENLAGFISQDYHEQIKKVKDLSAAAVLISSIFASIIGLIVLVPKVI